MTTITAYHSSASELLVPRRLLHVGTMEQAVMRGGAHLHEIVFDPGVHMARVRDHGDWAPRRLLRHGPRSKAIVYLNRTEGIPLTEFEEARAVADIDRIADARFRRLLPSSRDSWIIVDVDCVKSVRTLKRP